MPSKKTPAGKAKKHLPEIPKELVEQFVKGPMWGFHDHPDTQSTDIRTLIPR